MKKVREGLRHPYPKETSLPTDILKYITTNPKPLFFAVKKTDDLAKNVLKGFKDPERFEKRRLTLMLASKL